MRKTSSKRTLTQKRDLASRCYALLRKIPRGKVTTYQQLAHKLGTRGYRAVGQIVGRNPDAPKVPCHRVVRADGGLGGYALGLSKKIRLLALEGVQVEQNRIKDFSSRLFTF